MLGVSSCVERLTDGSPIILENRPEVPYILNSEAIGEIHEIIVNTTTVEPPYNIAAGPSILAWALILNEIISRVDSRKEAQHHRDDGRDPHPQAGALDDLPNDVYDAIVGAIKFGMDDVVASLGRSAVDLCRVFETLATISQLLGDTPAACFMTELGTDMRLVILDLIRSSSVYTGYITETLSATLSTLTGGQTYWDLVDAQNLEDENGTIGLFLRDDTLLQTFWKQALDRYPFESLPFLRLNRALAALCYYNEDDTLVSIVEKVESLPTFTYTLPVNFRDYVLVRENDNSNDICLTEDLYLFEPRWRDQDTRLIRGRVHQDQALALSIRETDLCIQRGSEGRIIYEAEPKVAYFYHPYSGIKYFGKLLETYLTAGDQIDATTGEKTSAASVEEIVGLFATVVFSASKAARTPTDSINLVHRFLESAGSGLIRNRDIISVVFDIFEEELQRQTVNVGPEVDLGVLISCVQFIHAMISFCPGRIWPLIDRCGLLGNNRGGGKLATIVGNVELVSSKFNLLISCIRLYEGLVNDFATNAIARKRKNTSLARFTDDGNFGINVPDHVISKVLLYFTRYMVNVMESSCTWKFDNTDDRLQISKNITATLDTVLYYAYGIQGFPDKTPESRLKKNSRSSTKSGEELAAAESARQIMGPLVPAATYLVEAFLSTSSGALRFRPLLRTLFSGFASFTSTDITVFPSRLRLASHDIKATLSFTKRLLRVSTFLERAASQVETQLFKAAPLIARLYAVKDAYRIPVVKLFEAMIVSASSRTEEPPSLLGHLGAQTSKNFLSVLSDLDKPLVREANIAAIWHFFSMVMSSRQQWFANYVLTGKTPRDALRQKDKTSRVTFVTLTKPLLLTALDTLSDIGDIPEKEALTLLEFVSSAQNFWPWTMYDMPSHKSFMGVLSKFISTLRPIGPTPRSETSILACYRARIAAYTAEILAMYLFHLRQTGQDSIVGELMPNLGYYIDHAAAIPTYNSSLHGNLKRNFDTKYASSTLQSFRRTNLEDRQFGREYFYDLELVNKMLRFDVAWKGRSNDGFKAELALANVNLSLVDAQIVRIYPNLICVTYINHLYRPFSMVGRSSL